MVCERMIKEIGMIEDKLTNIKWISVSKLDGRELLNRGNIGNPLEVH